MTDDEEIHIDEFAFVRLPIASDEGYWIDDDGNKVVYAFVVVQWNVTISSLVNSSNVWLQLELYLQIEHDDFSVAAPLDIAQLDLFKVTQFNTRVNYTSRIIELPKDDTIYGDELYYNWTIKAHAFGEIQNTTIWVHARGSLDGFDIFRIRWIASEGNINVELYVAIGSFGAVGTAGLFGSIRKKRRRTADLYN